MEDIEIRPVKMGGVIKNVSESGVIKLNLNGRLGVLYVPLEILDGLDSGEQPKEGDTLTFYFSYLWVTEELLDYDGADLQSDYGVEATLLGGTFTEVNDTAVLVSFMNGAGSIAVPRRWVFTDNMLNLGQHCQFYFSRMIQDNQED